MTISELVRLLEGMKKEHGDLETRIQGPLRAWPPEPIVKTTEGGKKWVLLNA